MGIKAGMVDIMFSRQGVPGGPRKLPHGVPEKQAPSEESECYCALRVRCQRKGSSCSK
ncbi:unnamed protein product [Pararhodospirillum photometricum DSM 122]|uniref:Uncharacterized protein n=1 Tax=Pararhodospirillum photometricum DSM 122 TaxID=1150469 RepID=H6SR04_PARPM|nr:unnamed protein product [Pararhodospirillum photometricum DSM 122]